MNDLNGMRLLSATLVVCTGAVCMAIGGLSEFRGDGSRIGFLMVVVGVPLFIWQWFRPQLMALLTWKFDPADRQDAERVAEPEIPR